MRNRSSLNKQSFLKLLSSLLIFNPMPLIAEDYTQAVGTIYCDGGIRGIATHIKVPKDFAANHSVIVTAAHVIYNPQTDQLFSQCDYRPQNKRLGGIEFKTISAHNYSTKNSDKVDQAESDLIFIKLKHRAYQPTLKLSKNFSNEASKLSFISSDLDNFKQTECQKINNTHVTSDKLLLHNCPADVGSSGSPIIDGQSSELVAVNGGRFNFQTTKNSHKDPQWIGQARRIDSMIDLSLRSLGLELTYSF